MRTTIHFMLATLALGAPAIHAQQTPPPPTGGMTVESSPGKAKAQAAVEMTATVTAVDKATRKLTLKGPKGKTVDVVASDEVRNFDQIQVGDRLVVKYLEALSLELRKTKGATSEVTASGAAARSAPGDRPGGVVAQEVKAVAEVVAVDPAKSVISLKGPQGNVVDVKVKNKDHFKVVKKGDHVDITYTEALAIAVKPAAKPAAK